MPAYRERIHICPQEDGAPTRVLPFPLFWDRRAFFEKFGHRRVDTGNPVYVDYGILLSASEAIDWHRQCVATLERNSEEQAPHMIDAIRRWTELLRAANWVIVESYEWESGLS